MANKQVEYPYGLIAGGMGDGTVNIWDPAKLIASHPQPQVHDFTGTAVLSFRIQVPDLLLESYRGGLEGDWRMTGDHFQSLPRALLSLWYGLNRCGLFGV